MQFIAKRKTFYFLSGIFFFLSLSAFLFVPKNFGIDMTGGLQIEYTSASPISPEQLSNVRADILNNYVLDWRKDVITDVLAYMLNADVVRLEIGLLQEKNVVELQKITSHIRETIPTFFAQHTINVSESSFVSVGQSFGKFVLDRAYLTVTICLFVIVFYLMYAFRHSIEGTSSFTFGAITLATLAHDIIIASGIYILLGTLFPILKVDTFFCDSTSHYFGI
jgi:preprotein translocase subunit SecF